MHPTSHNLSSAQLSRAQGCLLGQLAGDALGSLVEFQTPDSIGRYFPAGVRDMMDGGTWNTLAGQPTDDSEMALMLARTLVRMGKYDKEAVLAAYRFWMDSHPFDCGMTVSAGLRGDPNPVSQANGALMRISPLGIFGLRCSLEEVAELARQDAALTHPHPLCQQVNALYATALVLAIRDGLAPEPLYARILEMARLQHVDPLLLQVTREARDAPPKSYTRQEGWVLIAWQNALWQLLRSPEPETAIIDTVMRGGDTDTNAAICGALLGALYGIGSIPQRWRSAILNCRPQQGLPEVMQPRPECFWPVDALKLALQLAAGGAGDQCGQAEPLWSDQQS